MSENNKEEQQTQQQEQQEQQISTERVNVATTNIIDKIGVMRTEFYKSLEEIPMPIQKTARNADNAKEYIYDKLSYLEEDIFNKSNTHDLWRQELLQKLRKSLVEGRQELLQALKADFHQSNEATQYFELDQLVDEIDCALKNYKYWIRERVDVPLTYQANSDAFMYYEPNGIVLVVGDWHQPLLSVLKPAINAIAAGNHVVLYPNPLVTNTVKTLREVVNKNLDTNKIDVLEGEYTSEELLSLPIDQVYAHGPEYQLNEISRVAGEKSIPCVLNKDTFNIALVHQSCDLNEAAEKIVLSRFNNAGQTITAPDQVYVHESIFTDFVVKSKINIYCNYKHADKNPDYARIINVDKTKSLLDLIEHQHDGQLETKVNYDIEDRLIEPIIIIDPSDDSKILENPLRGPILILRKYSNFDEITKNLSARKNINNLYYFGKNLEPRSEILHNFKRTHVHINEAGLNVFNPNLPTGSIGGIFNSKIGGQNGFKSFSQSRLVVEGKGLHRYKNLIPPYSTEKYKNFHQLDILKKFTNKQAKFAAVGAGLYVGYKFFF